MAVEHISNGISYICLQKVQNICLITWKKYKISSEDSFSTFFST